MVAHWIIVSDASRARGFEADMLLEELVEIFDVINPASRATSDELVRDRAGLMGVGHRSGARAVGEAAGHGAHRGRAAGPPSPRTARGSRSNPKTTEATLFARAVGEKLRDGLKRGAYERLILVAPPAFLGKLRRQIRKPLADRVVATFAKDLMFMPAHELAERLRHDISEVATPPGQHHP